MAKAHSTPRRRRVVPRRCQERRIKVHQAHYGYRRKPDQDNPYHAGRSVPWVQLKGDWLAAAGFIIDMPIKVRVMEGCLVLTILTPGEAGEE